MVLDIQESLMSSLYTTLTGDATLKSLMGGTVRLYPIHARPNAAFPYLVNRIDMGIDGDWNPVRRCTYYLDIWSNSDKTEETTDIRQRIMTLIDDYNSSTDETTDFRLWIQTDGFIPEMAENIFHYAIQFNLKFLRDSQVGVKLNR